MSWLSSSRYNNRYQPTQISSIGNCKPIDYKSLVNDEFFKDYKKISEKYSNFRGKSGGCDYYLKLPSDKQYKKLKKVTKCNKYKNIKAQTLKSSAIKYLENKIKKISKKFTDKSLISKEVRNELSCDLNELNKIDKS